MGPQPTDDQPPAPVSPESEAYVVQACLADRDVIPTALAIVDAADFCRPSLAKAFEVAALLHGRGQDSSYASVSDWLEPHEQEAVRDAYSSSTGTTRVAEHAQRVAEAATLRRLMTGMAEADGLARKFDMGAVDLARSTVDQLQLPRGVLSPSSTISEFMAVTDEYDWLVPGLLERGDRLLLTGPEGAGKSMLERQMAVSIAAGMHPFEYHPFFMNGGGVPSVSVFDMENGPGVVRRKLAPMLAIEGVRRNLDPERLRIECRPGGADLTSRHDRRWLTERIMANRPDLVVIGPLYKLYDGDPNDERLARTVASVFDDLRARFGVTLIIEAHSPHGPEGRKRDLRPFGSSLWRRWPEFGYGLQPEPAQLVDGVKQEGSVKLVAWRGDRDEREWPARLERSRPWPWGTGRDRGRPVHASAGRYEPDNDQF